MKKSVESAKLRAQNFSAMYPGKIVWVFDKKGKRAVIVISGWVWHDRILEGWRPVVAYKAGKEV